MAWRRTGDNLLSEAMQAKSNDAYMRHSAKMSWLEYLRVKMKHLFLFIRKIASLWISS